MKALCLLLLQLLLPPF
jgi:hypothetical protein